MVIATIEHVASERSEPSENEDEEHFERSVVDEEQDDLSYAKDDKIQREEAREKFCDIVHSIVFWWLIFSFDGDSLSLCTYFDGAAKYVARKFRRALKVEGVADLWFGDVELAHECLDFFSWQPIFLLFFYHNIIFAYSLRINS